MQFTPDGVRMFLRFIFFPFFFFFFEVIYELFIKGFGTTVPNMVICIDISKLPSLVSIDADDPMAEWKFRRGGGGANKLQSTTVPRT